MMRVIKISCLLLLPFLSLAQQHISLKQQLLSMVERDQASRKQVGQHGWDKAPQALKTQVASIDEYNTKALKVIVAQYGWPSVDLVGVSGVAAAFLIVQHSPDSAFQASMLPRIKQSYFDNEGISGQALALLTDRVLIGQGKAQRYGTQFDIKEGGVVFKPIADISNIDQRRAQMKMASLAYYLKFVEELYGLKDHPEVEL